MTDGRHHLGGGQRGPLEAGGVPQPTERPALPGGERSHHISWIAILIYYCSICSTLSGSRGQHVSDDCMYVMFAVAHMMCRVEISWRESAYFRQ